jgi:hypothetical protein
MPNIRLSDAFGLDIEFEPAPGSSIAKYFQNLVHLRFSALNVAALRATPLDQLPFQSLSQGLSFEQPIAVGPGRTELTISGGTAATLSIHVTEGEDLLDRESFGDPFRVSPEQAYLALGLTASFSTALSGGAGDLSAGFAAGSQAAVTNFRAFPKNPTSPAFLSALRKTLREYVIPGDLADLKAIPEGSLITVEGRGTLELSAQLNLLAVANPLASVALPEPAGTLTLRSGASLPVSASFELAGDYQLRVHKTGAERVRLGYYKRRGSELTVKASVRAGLEARVGGFELFSRLLGAISSDPRADEAVLENAGLSPAEIAAVEGAIQGGLDRKLQLAASFELAALQSDEAAFLYEIELDSLDERGKNAVHQALDGNLGLLTENEERLPIGIEKLKSLVTAMEERRHTLQVNLVGIYNYLSLAKLATSGSVLYDPTTGDLVLADRATASRFEAGMVRFGVDSERLRQVLAEDFLVTAAYRSSKLVASAPELECTHGYFELHGRTNRQTMKDNLDVAQALGLISELEKLERLAGLDDFGRSTLFVATRYGEERAVSLFLDQKGRPRGRVEYERAGRKAIELLVQKDDPDAYRRAPAIDDELWKQMREAGPSNLKPLFPALTSLQVAVIVADYTTIVWWAGAMRELAEKLEAIRQFFAENPDPHPENNALKTLRRQLAQHMRSVAANTRKEFGDPWGLVAMDIVSGGRAEARVIVTAPRLALAAERTEPPARGVTSA